MKENGTFFIPRPACQPQVTHGIQQPGWPFPAGREGENCSKEREAEQVGVCERESARGVAEGGVRSSIFRLPPVLSFGGVGQGWNSRRKLQTELGAMLWEQWMPR